MATAPTIRPLSSLNERLVALEIIHQVLSLRYSLHLRQLVVDAINDTEEPIARMIRDALRTDAGVRDPAQVRTLQRLIDQINAMRAQAWDAGQAALTADIGELATDDHQKVLFGWLFPSIVLVTPAATVLTQRALTTPFQGRTLAQWLEDAATDDARRIRSEISIGAALGETPEQIARRVVGSASARGADGATQISRNHIDTIARSAVTHVVSQSKDEFHKANANVAVTPQHDAPTSTPPIPTTGRAVQVFTLEQFVAVLDSRTTPLCRGLDENRYKLGEGPIPPLHMNCRSIRVLVLPEVLGGPVYKPGRYADWIRTQPQAVQVELMGAARVARMRKGTLDPGAFVDYGSRPMTLDQVKAAAKRLMGAY